MDGAAARDDAGYPGGGEWDIAKPHAGVDRKVIHPLFGLLDQGVTKHLPCEVFSFAADFFQSLVNRNRADRHRRVTKNPFPGLVNILAGRQVHDRIGAPAGRPDHLLNFFFNGGGDGGISDVGIDLHQEVPADDHRLEFRMVNIAWDDGSPARDLITHELGRDFRRDACTPGVSGMLGDQAVCKPAVVFGVAIATLIAGGQRFFAPKVFSERDEFHLGGDKPLAGVVHLAHVHAGLRSKRFSKMCES